MKENLIAMWHSHKSCLCHFSPLVIFRNSFTKICPHKQRPLQKIYATSKVKGKVQITPTSAVVSERQSYFPCMSTENLCYVEGEGQSPDNSNIGSGKWKAELLPLYVYVM